MLSTFKTKLLSKQQLTSDVWLFRFGLVEPTELLFSPGQYLIIFVPQEDGTTLRRLYSITSSSRETKSFELLIQIIPGGKASCYLSCLKENQELMFQGPAGVFTLRESSRSKVFLATGTGIAPIQSMLLDIKSNVILANGVSPESQWDSGVSFKSDPQNNSKYVLFWGLKMYKDIYLLEELKQLQVQNPNFQFHICLSREQSLDMIPEPDRKYFLLGRITKGTNEERLTMKDYDYYLCGGREVVESLRTYLADKNIPKEQIYFEKF